MPKFGLSPTWKAGYLHQITWSFGKGLPVLKINLITAECVICTVISEMFRFLNVKYKMSFSRVVRFINCSLLVCLKKSMDWKQFWIALIPADISCNCLESQTQKHPEIRNFKCLSFFLKLEMKIQSCFGGLCGITLWDSTQLEITVHMEYTLSKNGWSPEKMMALVIVGRPIKSTSIF